MNKAENNIRKTSFKKAGQALIDHIQETEKVDLQRIEQSLEDLKTAIRYNTNGENYGFTLLLLPHRY